MNPENTTKLLTAYPMLYRELRERRFECEDGWFELVWQVSAEIEVAAHLEGIPKTAEAWPAVRILKQKLGTLRVQSLNSYSGTIRALVEKAYEKSMETCELCGAPAKTTYANLIIGYKHCAVTVEKHIASQHSIQKKPSCRFTGNHQHTMNGVSEFNDE